MKKLLLLFALVLSSIGVNAQQFEVDGIQYKVLTTSPDYTVEVTKYNTDYEGDLILNGTVSYAGHTYKVVRINDNSFSSCRKKLVVNDLPYCTSIGDDAFISCSSLTSIGDLSACISIGHRAFMYCSSLTSIGDLSACTHIGWGCFQDCTLESLTLPATPPTLEMSFYNNQITFLVPESAVATYRAAKYWSDIKMQIVSKDAKHTWDVAAPVLNSIGADQFANVMTLKVSGNIDSDDIMYMRNKMSNLHHLDLTDATFVASNKEYATGYKTKDNSVSGFFDMLRLRSVKLPASAKVVEKDAFKNCSYLNDVTIPEGIERIEANAFKACALTAIQLPEGISDIGESAFHGCKSLKAVAFPSTLNTIAPNAFTSCPIASVSLPENLKTIDSYAFSFNSALTELRIPSSVESIGANAFYECNNLKDIYTYTVQPININSNTFSSYAAATLHLPTQGFNDYYASPTWGQFPELVAFDEPYKYFYITDDFVLLSGKRFESPEGEDLNINAYAGSSITIEGETNQEVGNIDIQYNGLRGASVIPDNNLMANTVTFHIDVTGQKWRFLCFPFRVKLSNVQAPGSYVFRRYNGEKRASGNSGWENLSEGIEYLEPGVGYIFQSNNSGALDITVDQPDFSWATSTKTNALKTYAAAVDEDASWNLVGNPLTCYYDIDDMEYDAPLTIWDGAKYVAYRPGDDNYQLSPFEAIFVQKPDNSSVPTYQKGKRMSYNAAQKKHNDKIIAARMMAPGKRDRMLLNLVLSNGEQQDQTRVVFNEKKTTGYEKECDAAKFISMEQVPQLYTLEQQTQFAINERQTGSVQVGFMAPKAGSYTLKVERMDMPVVLKDNLTGTTFDFNNGEYIFESEEGTFDSRFLLMPAAETTGIATMTTANASKSDIPAYTLDGKQLPKGEAAKGIVVKNGKKVVKN
ncbi:MAG: leucine-rich repeat domain-containing protein [Prevotella sp.]|nr:leucine-rich repeat domain-containing protein [Prevotella sp.]